MSTTMTTTTTTDNGQIMIRKEHLSLRLGEPKTFFVLILILHTSNILFKFICRWCLGGKSLTELIFVEFRCTSCNKCIVWCNLMVSNIFEQNSEYIVYFLDRWNPQKYNRNSLEFLDDCKILIREKIFLDQRYYEKTLILIFKSDKPFQSFI